MRRGFRMSKTTYYRKMIGLASLYKLNSSIAKENREEMLFFSVLEPLPHCSCNIVLQTITVVYTYYHMRVYRTFA